MASASKPGALRVGFRSCGMASETGSRVAAADSAIGPVQTERQILTQVNELRDEIRSGRLSDADGGPTTADAVRFDDAVISIDDDLVWDVIEPEPDETAADEFVAAGWGTVGVPPIETQAAPVVKEAANPFPPAGEAPADACSTGGSQSASDGRRYAQLFTRLKRRRREMAETLRSTIPFADR